MIKEFQLGATKWKVKIANEYLDNKERYGESSYDESLIRLQDKTLGNKRSEDAVEQVLYHEVCHAILDTLGYGKLSDKEEFVQQFSLLIHQFEKTKK